MKAIVAAFEPFGGRMKNRAQRAVRHLRNELTIAELPTSFARLPAALDALLLRETQLLLCVGESESARGLEVERFAVNLADARIPDNDGAQPRALALETGGPAARAVRFSVDEVVARIIAAGVPARASAHAGTFCCNAALYYALQRTEGRTPLVAFIHVPNRRRYLRASNAAHGLRAAVLALLEDTSNSPNFR